VDIVSTRKRDTAPEMAPKRRKARVGLIDSLLAKWAFLIIVAGRKHT
jgi:hypothetical protein